MCSRAAMRVALLPFVALCASALHVRGAAAQDVRAYQRRVDSLVVVWRRAQAARVADEERRRKSYETSVAVSAGPLRLLASPGRQDLARQAGDAVVADLSPMYGRALDTLRSNTFVIRDHQPEEAGRTDSNFVRVLEVTQHGGEPFRLVLRPDLPLVTNALRTAVLRALLRSADPGLAFWLQTTDLPSDTLPSREWAAARLNFLSSVAAVARRCYAGDLGACRLALRITESADPLTQLYDSTDRRRLVDMLARDSWRGAPPGTDACLSGSDAACVTILRRGHSAHPVSAVHRSQLLQVAMVVGGPGAMERLMSTNGGVDARLAAAARAPTDTLLKAWLARVRAGEKPSDNMSPALAAVSVGWILAFTVLGLRSSRWR